MAKAGRIKTAVVIAVCVSPSAGVNIWPQVQPMLAGADVDGGAILWLLIQAAFVITMAWLPVRLETLEWRKDGGKKLGGYVFAAFLFLLNFANAVQVASHKQDSRASAARGTMNEVASLRSQLKAAQDARTALGQFTPATEEMVKAADAAVETARENRKKECDTGRKDRCEKRQEEERSRQAEQRDFAQRRALTNDKHELNAKIAELETKLNEIGPAPEHEDAGALRVGKALQAALWLLGVKMEGDQAAPVMEWTPTAQALAVEAIALVVPLFFLHDRDGGRVPVQPTSGWRFWRLFRRSRREATTAMPMHVEVVAAAQPAAITQTLPAPAPALLPSPQGRPEAPEFDSTEGDVAGVAAGVASAGVKTPRRAAVRKTPATPAVPQKPKASNKKSAAGVGSVREWFEERTTAREGHDLKASEAYDNYKAWCENRGLAAVALTKFGTEMRDELQVKKHDVRRRTFYRDIALRQQPQLAVANLR